MLLDIFVLTTTLSFFLFFIGLTDLLKLAKSTRVTIMIISTIMFFYLAFSSMNIENQFCSYGSSWTCTTQTTNDTSLMIFCIMFAALSLLYVIMESFGMMPKEVPEGKEI